MNINVFVKTHFLKKMLQFLCNLRTASERVRQLTMDVAACQFRVYSGVLQLTNNFLLEVGLIHMRKLRACLKETYSPKG
jgi:hypothetical protein